MAIPITLYRITEDSRKVGKTLPSAEGSFLEFSTSWLKDIFRIMTPDLTLASNTDLTSYNYMKVGAPVNRVYFIKPEILRTGLWRLNAREDVLTQFATQIRNQSGILSRSETVFNIYLSDHVFNSLVYRRTQTIPFPGHPFTTANGAYFLVTTGGYTPPEE